MVAITAHPGNKPWDVSRAETTLAGNEEVLNTWKHSLPATEVIGYNRTKAKRPPIFNGFDICLWG